MSAAGPSPRLDPLIDALAEQIALRLHQLQREQQREDPTETAHSPWLNLNGAADHLAWPKQRLYKLTASGAIPHYKQDGRLLFRRDELDTWLAGYAQGERPTLPPGSELC